MWYKCVVFHDHTCPGPAIGFKVVEAAKQKRGIPILDGE
jgi:formylmethanofuran dehydrogenase subunit E